MANPSFSLLQGDPTTWGIPAVGSTFIGVNGAGQIVLKQNNGTITSLTSSAPSMSSQNNTAGSTTVTLGAQLSTAFVNIMGTARSVPLILDITGALSGAQLKMLVNLPAAAGLALDIRNANSGGTQLDTFTSDGSILTACWEFVYDGAAWQKVRVTIPAY